MKTICRICFLLLFSLVLAACAPGSSLPTGGDPESIKNLDNQDIVLDWSREGGISGFCDRLIILASGEAVVTNCQKEQIVELGRMSLQADQLALFVEKMKQFQSFKLVQSDPAVTDAMTIKMQFYGKGDSVASEAAQQELLDQANKLFILAKQK